MPSILGQCVECCESECLTPQIQWDSRSAGSVNCGYFEHILSSPPKKYLTREVVVSYNHTITTVSLGEAGICCTRTTQTVIASSGGTQTDNVDVDTCVTTTTPTPANGTETDGYMREGLTYGPLCPCTTGCTGCGVYDIPYSEDSSPLAWNHEPGGAGWSTSSSTTSTVLSVAMTYTPPPNSSGGSGLCGCPLSTEYTGSGAYSRTVTLSNEFTPEMLKNKVLASLPAFDNDWNDTPDGFVYWSYVGGDTYYNVREAKYRFKFKIPTNRKRRGSCYKLSWIERFRPYPSGSPVYGAVKSWTWDGVVPEGYDPDDSTTWPTSPEYLLDISEESGTSDIGMYQLPEDPASFFVKDKILVECEGCE